MTYPTTGSSRMTFDCESACRTIRGLMDQSSTELDKITNRPDNIFVLGATNSGKSTLINFLAGCTMERQGEAIDTIRVKSDSSIPEQVKIGHTTQAETLALKVITTAGLCFVDCPGFFDTRGPETSLANMASTLKGLHNSRAVRIIILMNYASLEEERTGGLRKTIRVAKQFFGSEESLLDQEERILFGITKIPLLGPRDSDSRDISLLKRHITTGNMQLTEKEQEVAKLFARRLFTYFIPQDQNSMRYNGACSRGELLQKIEKLPSIETPQDTFRAHLEEREIIYLGDLETGLRTQITTALEEQDYNEVSLFLALSHELGMIPHPRVMQLVIHCRSDVLTYLKKEKERIEEEALRPNVDRTFINQRLQRIEELLSVLPLGEKQVLERQFSLSELKEKVRLLLTQLVARYQLSVIEQQMKAQDHAFNQKKLQRLYHIFRDIIVKCQLFETRHREFPLLIQEVRSIKEKATEKTRGQLTFLLTSVNDLARAERQKREIEEKLALEKAMDAAEKRDWEEKFRNLEAEINSLRAQL